MSAGLSILCVALAAAPVSLRVQSGLALGGDGSEARPFSSIGEAVGRASPGSVIEVGPGLYEEALELVKPVTILGAGKVVLAPPPGSARAIEVRGEVSLRGLEIQGGRVGISVEQGIARLDHVQLRGQPDVALVCAIGARCELSAVGIESSFASAVGIRDAGELHVDGVRLGGPFRRAIEVLDGNLLGRDLEIKGAVTGVHQLGGKVSLRDSHFEELRGSCVFGAKGALELVEPVFEGCEVAVEVRDAERVRLTGAIVARCARAALTSVLAFVDASDLVVIGPSKDGAVNLGGGETELRDALFRTPGVTAVTSRLGKLRAAEVLVDGARGDVQHDFGNAFFLEDSHVEIQGLSARNCEGAAIETQAGSGRIVDLDVAHSGLAAVAYEHEAILDVDGIRVRGGSGTGIACIEHGKGHILAPELRNLAGGPYLVDCSCQLAVRPADPALTACPTVR